MANSSKSAEAKTADHSRAPLNIDIQIQKRGRRTPDPANNNPRMHGNRLRRSRLRFGNLGS